MVVSLQGYEKRYWQNDGNIAEHVPTASPLLGEGLHAPIARPLAGMRGRGLNLGYASVPKLLVSANYATPNLARDRMST